MPTSLQEAYERYTAAGRRLDWIRAEYRSLTLPPEERPDREELIAAEDKYAQAIRDFHQARSGSEEAP
jgi:hypothetical protein